MVVFFIIDAAFPVHSLYAFALLLSDRAFAIIFFSTISCCDVCLASRLYHIVLEKRDFLRGLRQHQRLRKRWVCPGE
jgi:hypothetical protein